MTLSLMHDDTQEDDAQHNDTWLNEIQERFILVYVVMLTAKVDYLYADCI